MGYMPSIAESDDGYLNLDNDRVSIKTVPLNYVIYNIKNNIRLLRLSINKGDINANRQYIELVELFEEEMHPYLDDIYFNDLEEKEEEYRKVLKDDLKVNEQDIIEDNNLKIAVESSKIRYRLLNSLLCRKNIYPPRTFIDVVDPLYS